MKNTFFVSDTHFGHHNILSFEKLFFPQETIDERDEHLIELWNQTVKPDDEIVHLGDVAFNTRLPLLNRLHGKKELLIMGNHEHKPASEYLKYFKDVKACLEIRKLGALLTHYPVHPCQLAYRYKVNVHGHMHSKHVSLPDDGGMVLKKDPRYICLSIENTALKPIHYDELEAIIKLRFPPEDEGETT